MLPFAVAEHHWPGQRPGRRRGPWGCVPQGGQGQEGGARLNLVILTGRVAGAPELHHVPSGVAVCSFPLAVDRESERTPGDPRMDVLDVVVWSAEAERAFRQLRQGRTAGVQGRLQLRSYDDRTGQRREVVEVVATRVRLLDRAPGAAPREGPPGAKRSPWPPAGASASF